MKLIKPLLQTSWILYFHRQFTFCTDICEGENETTRITRSWLGIPHSRPETVDSSNSYNGPSAPCPAASRTVQLPSTRPLGNPFVSMNDGRLRTIFSVGFSATPWNFLNPVTWTVVTGEEGPSEPIYMYAVLCWAARWPLPENLESWIEVANISKSSAVGKACLLRHRAQTVATAQPNTNAFFSRPKAYPTRMHSYTRIKTFSNIYRCPEGI